MELQNLLIRCSQVFEKGKRKTTGHFRHNPATAPLHSANFHFQQLALCNNSNPRYTYSKCQILLLLHMKIDMSFSKDVNVSDVTNIRPYIRYVERC